MAARQRNWSCEARAANSASMRRVNSLTCFLARPLAMFRSAQTEVPQEAIVFVTLGIRRGEQLFAHENGIRAGKKTQAHGFDAQRIASGAQAHHGCRHEQTRRSNHASQDKSVRGLRASERSALDSHEHVDGHTFGMRLKIRQLL